jgi:8-oxo-dGTP diphosphatase
LTSLSLNFSISIPSPRVGRAYADACRRGEIVATMADNAPSVVVGAALLRGVPPHVEVLAAQRGYPSHLAGMWEFPGGKVEPGEDETGALRRECREELGVEIDVGERIGPDVAVVGGGAILRVWTAHVSSGVPAPTEHSALRWLSKDELYDVAWLAPDVPIVDALAKLLGLP